MTTALCPSSFGSTLEKFSGLSLGHEQMASRTESLDYLLELIISSFSLSVPSDRSFSVNLQRRENEEFVMMQGLSNTFDSNEDQFILRTTLSQQLVHSIFQVYITFPSIVWTGQFYGYESYIRISILLAPVAHTHSELA